MPDHFGRQRKLNQFWRLSPKNGAIRSLGLVAFGHMISFGYLRDESCKTTNAHGRTDLNAA